ncbi:MAG: hypothetical protein AAGK22_14230 [Acidobacteriota bacterium]
MTQVHSPVRFLLGEAWQEFRNGFRGPLVPMIWAGLVLYTTVILMNSEYMREMGAVDVPRNSPHIVYLMGTGQMITTFFAWAWVFAQVVVRDQSARLHEVVMATPVSLRLLLVARYLGATGIAVLLGWAILLGIVLAPLYEAIGIIPPNTSGPTPWFALGLTTLVHVIPASLGIGALFVSATIWTRSTVGPFSVAALLMMLWMTSMIVLRGGDIELSIASIIDPSGYAEMEEQTLGWTPAERQVAVIEPTRPFLVNRAVWLFPPLLLFAATLLTVKRERLVLERSSRSKGQPKPARTRAAADAAAEGSLGSTADRPSWWRALYLEARWQLRIATRGFGFRLTLVLLLLAAFGSASVNFIQHKTGPKIPTLAALMDFMGENFYLVFVFIIAAFAGLLVRRDERQGFAEWFDASRAPLLVRVAAKAITALGVTLIFCAVPAVAVSVISLVAAPEAYEPLTPFLFFLGYYFPSLAELSVLVLLTHAVIRHAGTAYAISMLFAFIAVINHELGVVQYPPLQLAIPPHMALSSITGWTPWTGMLVAVNAFKMALATLFGLLAVISWRRGTALTTRDRFRAAAVRLRGAPGLLLAATLLGAVGLFGLLNQRLVATGEYESIASSIAGDAEWESELWTQASSLALAGGSVSATLDPRSRSGEALWTIEGLETPEGTLHATVPHGVEVASARIDGAAADLESIEDHLIVQTPACSESPCSLELDLRVRFEDWPVEDPPWLRPESVWLRAELLLPRLGHDPHRLVRGPLDRLENELSKELPELPEAGALVTALGVAPAGSWTWNIEYPEGHAVGATGGGSGPLDFASVWMPRPPSQKAANFTTLWHTASFEPQADAVQADVLDAVGCVGRTLGIEPRVEQAVQVPAHAGELRLFDDVLWLPEDVAWGVADEGFGRTIRQYEIARALAQRAVVDMGDLRLSAGADWLLEAVSGWVGLRCVEEVAGARKVVELRSYQAEQISQELGTMGSPVADLETAYGDWLAHYAALALDSWSAAPEAGNVAEKMGETLAQIRSGRSVREALSSVVGGDVADGLLGPMRSFDVTVRLDGGEVEAGGTRWVWSDGGWGEDRQVTRFVLQNLDQPQSAQWFDPSRLPGGDARKGLYLSDPTPGFERSPADNFLVRQE